MANLLEEIRDNLFDAIESDRLQLPTLPEAALKIREAAEDPEVSISSFTKALENDAAISARVIKTANSPLFRGAKNIDSLKMAVGRLGITYTCNLATGLAMEQMFQATSDLIDKRLRQVWSNSTEVAGISNVLAKHYTDLPPDEATLAGLTHQIGILPILSFAEDNEQLLSDSITLETVIDKLHPHIGTRILKAWDFPQQLVVVPKGHLNYKRQKDKADLADVVMVANLQSYIGTDHPLAKCDWSQISAFERIGLEPSFDAHEAEDLGDDLAAAMEMLGT